MKKYLSPLIISALSLQCFAEQNFNSESVAKLVPVLAHLQPNDDTMTLKLMTMMTSLLKIKQSLISSSRKLEASNIKDLSQAATTKEELEFLRQMANLSDAGKLEDLIRYSLSTLESSDKLLKSNPQLAVLKVLNKEKKEYLITALTNSITSIVQMRGLSTKIKKVSYTEWTMLSDNMQHCLDNATNDNILEFANSEWVYASEVKPLINGPVSFELRDRLISQAQKSIDILTWSIYDDFTGKQAIELFLKKQKFDNVKVRIIVDGQIALTLGHRQYISQLEKLGIEVIRWFNKDIPYLGQHRKMIIVDDYHVITGGMNFGDVYSHKNPKEKSKWRDTDFYFNGNAAITAKNLFADIWNEQIKSNKTLNFSKIEKLNESKNQSTYKLAIINHDPTVVSRKGSTIMMTLLKAIRQASRTIDIENAYIVMFPTLKNELTKAIQQRNVKVRLLTNSPNSVDEPIVSLPILRSAKMMAAENAEVYLKNGDTLHSKFAIIDGRFTFILSYNLHPRSERIEGEMAVLFDNEEVAKNLTTVFENDISAKNAIYLNQSKDTWEESIAIIPTLRVFFDLL